MHQDLIRDRTRPSQAAANEELVRAVQAPSPLLHARVASHRPHEPRAPG